MNAARRTDNFPPNWGTDAIYCDAACDPEDTFYIEPEIESSQTVSQRQKRYADAGRRFLDGHTPCLLSATLKGPFDRASGWKNPWAKTQDSIYDIPNDDTFASSLQPKIYRKTAAGKHKVKGRRTQEQYLPSPESLKQEPTGEHPYLDDDEVKAVQSWRENVAHSPVPLSRRLSKTDSWLKTTSRKRKFEEEPTQRQTLAPSERYLNTDNITSNLPPVARLKSYNSAPAQLDNGAGFYRSPTHSSTKAPQYNSQPTQQHASNNKPRSQPTRPASESEDELSQECSQGVIMTTPVSMKNTGLSTCTPKSSPLKKEVHADIVESPLQPAGPSDHSSYASSADAEFIDAESDCDMEGGGVLIEEANPEDPSAVYQDITSQQECSLEVEEDSEKNEEEEELEEEEEKEEQEPAQEQIVVDASEVNVTENAPQLTTEGDESCAASATDQSSEAGSSAYDMECIDDEPEDTTNPEAAVQDKLPNKHDSISEACEGQAVLDTKEPDAMSQEEQEEKLPLSAVPAEKQVEEVQQNGFEQVEPVQGDSQKDDSEQAEFREGAIHQEEVLQNDLEQQDVQQQEDIQQHEEASFDVHEANVIAEGVQHIPETRNDNVLEEPSEVAQVPIIAAKDAPIDNARNTDATASDSCCAEASNQELQLVPEASEVAPDNAPHDVSSNVADGVTPCDIEGVSQLQDATVTEDTEMQDGNDIPAEPAVPIAASPSQPLTSEFSFRSVIQRFVPASPWSTLSMVAAQALAKSRPDTAQDDETAALNSQHTETPAVQVENATTEMQHVENDDDQKRNIEVLETTAAEDPITAPTACGDEAPVAHSNSGEDVDMSIVKEEPSAVVLPSIEVAEVAEPEVAETAQPLDEGVASSVVVESSPAPEVAVEPCAAVEQENNEAPQPLANNDVRGPTPEPQFNFTSFASFASPLKMRKAAKKQLKAGGCSREGILRPALDTIPSDDRAKKRVTWAATLEEFKECEDNQARGIRGYSPPPTTALGDLPTSRNDKFRGHFSAVVNRTDGLRHKFRNYSKHQRAIRANEARDFAREDVPMSDAPLSKEKAPNDELAAVRRQPTEEPMDIVEDLFAEMGDFLEAFD